MSARAAKVFARVNWGISALLMLAIVLMVNWLGFRHYERWDWTSAGLYSLSDRTKKELSALRAPLTIHVFMSETETNFGTVKELLDRYRAETTLLAVDVVDPDRDPARYKLMVQKYQVGTAMDVNSGDTFADVALVVESGGQHWSVTRDDLVGFDVESLEDEAGPKVDVKAEQALTGAIVQVVSGEATKVCLTEGHGEWALSAGGRGRSLVSLQDELRRDNVTVEALATQGLADVPKACTALYIVGPVKAFADTEREAIRRYVLAGGNALFALDPVLEAGAIAPSGLESLLLEWGIATDANVVLELSADRLLPPGNPAGPFFVLEYGKHTLTEALEKLKTPWVARLARSVRGTRDGVTVLAQTSTNAYAETSMSELASSEQQPSRGEKDLAGPVPVAVAATPGTAGAAAGGHGGRVVVIGDSDWLSPELMRPDLANRDLVGAVTGWLTARSTLIAIAPKKLDAQRVRITESDLSTLFWRLLVMIPGAAMVLGLGVWWSRRA